jgi:hypothetical protein
MSSKTHNKKRNVILMYEFLVRAISKSLLQNDKRTQAIALKILKNNFRPGTELYKEFRIANALYKTTVSNASVASSILAEAKVVIKSLDESKLDKEKSILIREVNYGFKDESFYDQPLGDYKVFATIQTLFNEWKHISDLTRLAEFEDKINTWLITPKDKIQESHCTDLDNGSIRLATKIMTQKLNEKYSTLNESQKNIIKLYVLSESNIDVVRQHLNTIKQELLTTLTENVIKDDQRLSSIKQIVLDESLSEINDDTVSRFMMYSQLIDEMKKGE